MESVFEKLAAQNDVGSARRLFKAATVTPTDSTKLVAAQPARPQRLARALIAKMTDPGIDAWLASILDAKVPLKKYQESPARAAMEILTERSGGAAREILERKLRVGTIEDRVMAAMGLGTSGNLGSATLLLKLLKEPEPNLRLAVLSSLSTLLAPLYDETKVHKGDPDKAATDLQEPAFKALGELLTGDKVWQVRAAARDTLVQMRNHASIPLLIAGLKAEKARAAEKPQPPAILVKALHQALVMMTGQDVPEGRDDLWAEFWAKEGPTFRLAAEEKGRKGRRTPPKGEGGYAKYFNLDIKSNRILFIIDCSGSMAEPIKLKGRYANIDNEATTKFELVKQEMEKVVRALPPTTSCNVILFSTKVEAWQRDNEGRPVMVKMNDANKERLIIDVGRKTPSGMTNIHGALDLALQLAGRGTFDPYYEANFDTIYFLTDGMPSAGEVTDTREINRRVAEANKLRKVVINAISFGERNQMAFLDHLARDNGGEHIHVE